MLVKDRIETAVSNLCDKCGVPAKHLATKETLSLLFCGHHVRQYEAGLFSEGFSVVETTK